MNPEVKVRWLAALRSGDYKQGKSYLAARGDDGVIRYCCLGVLCEIAVEEGVATRFDKQRTYIAYGTKEGDRDEAYLTQEIAAWADVPYNGHLDDDDEGSTQTNNLAVANDAEYSFEHIAKMIEENL